MQSVKTVFLILMENHNWSAIKGSTNAPYINNTILPMASHAEQYYNPTNLHPSLPNYLWLEAGTNFGITSDLLPSSAHQNTTNHLVTLLKNAGISWRSYQEDICGCACPLANTNLYVPRHNPMVYFDDVSNTNLSNSAFCIANVRPYSQLAGDLQSNVVARYNFLTPNLCNDMHNSSGCTTTNSVRNGDTWLSNNLPAILASTAYRSNGAVFITWDEGTGTSDGPIGMIVLSPLAKGGGYSNSIYYNHGSTLRTMQEIFNVGPLLGNAGKVTNLSDLFNFAGPQLALSPAAGLSATGFVGGPFSPNSQVYTLSNSGPAILNWSATNNSTWLNFSPSNGTLLAGSNVSITVSMNGNANNLAAGFYSNAIFFANDSGGGGSTNRSVSCLVSVPPPVASFFATPTSGTEPLLVTFTDTSSGNVTNSSWDFGDSTTTNTTSTNLTHTYAAGTWDVSLIATGPGGSSTNTQSSLITVLTAFQAWQIQYFGSTTNTAADPNADPDGDGMNNFAEFLAGTDPTDSDSVLRITSIAQEGDDMRITWTMGSGRTNFLQVSPGDTFSNNFNDLFVITNTLGTITNYLDPGAATSAPARYYRVRLGP